MSSFPTFPYLGPDVVDRRPHRSNLPGGLLSLASFKGVIIAKLASLDVPGLIVVFSNTSFLSPPSRSERRKSAQWNEAGVAQSSPQFLEYKQTNPEERTYHVCMDAYNRPGGVANNLEADIANLFRLLDRVPGKPYAHRCLWTQGVQRFKCVVTDVQVPIELVSQDGGALQAFEATISLKEIR